MQRDDTVVALEISGIKREDTVNCIDGHGGNETGIINLDALDAVVLHDLFPGGVDRRKYPEAALIGFGCR